LLPPGCELKDLSIQKEELEIGAEVLLQNALQTLRRLQQSSSLRPARKQLSQDAKRSAEKMQKLIKEALASLAQLPDSQVMCSSEEYCTVIDNSAAIKRHIRALEKLRSQIIRAVNQGTRLAYAKAAKAQAEGKRYGSQVKRYTKGLISKAKALPSARYECSEIQGQEPVF